MKRRKIASLLMALALMGSSLTGCGNTGSSDAGSGADAGNAEAGDAAGADADAGDSGQDSAENGEEGERIPITIGGMYFPVSADEDYWPNPVVDYIQDKLNIELTLISYDNETLNLALASENLADIVMIGPDTVDNVLKGGHALALDPYLDTIGKNIAALETRNELMRKFKSDDTGSLYFRTPQTGVEDSLNGNGAHWSPYQVRWDLYQEIGGPEVYDGETYIAALKQMYELYHETPDGLPVYGKGVHSSGGVKEWVTSWGMPAIGQATIDSGGLYVLNMRSNDLVVDIYNESMDTAFWESMRFYNNLYNENLLDPDSFIMTSEDLNAKTEKGQYLSGNGPDYAAGSANHDPRQAGVRLVNTLGWYGSVFGAGWSDKLYFANAKGKNIEKAVEVLDYLDSSEFARITCCGLEGVHWEYDADGNAVLKEETIAMSSSADPETQEQWRATGINNGGIKNMGGISGAEMNPDGSRNSLWISPEIYAARQSELDKEISEFYGVDYIGQYHLQKMEEDPDRYYNMSGYNMDIVACMPATPQEITRIDSACEELVMNTIPQLVTAASQEDFDKAKEELLKNMKDLGAEESVQWWTTEWDKAKSFCESIS